VEENRDLIHILTDSLKLPSLHQSYPPTPNKAQPNISAVPEALSIPQVSFGQYFQGQGSTESPENLLAIKNRREPWHGDSNGQIKGCDIHGPLINDGLARIAAQKIPHPFNS